jgi:hypothetical protein
VPSRAAETSSPHDARGCAAGSCGVALMLVPSAVLNGHRGTGC